MGGHADRRQKGGQVAHREGAIQRPPASEGDHGGGDQGHDHLGGRGRCGARVGALDQVRLAPGHHLGHAVLFEGLAVLDLDDFDSVQALHHGCGQGRGLTHGALGRLARAARIAGHHAGGDGAADQDDQGQAHVLPQHDRHRGGDGQGVLHIVDQAVGGRLTHHARLIEDAGQVGAGVGFAQLGQIGAHQTCEQLHLNLADHLVADLIDQSGLTHLSQPAQDRH